MQLAALAAAASAVTACVFAAAAGAAVPGNATVGKALFLRAGLFCSSCHTLKADGSTGRDGPNLDQLKPGYAITVEVITQGRKPSRRWPTGMPAYTGPHGELTKARIQDLAAFVYNATHK